MKSTAPLWIAIFALSVVQITSCWMLTTKADDHGVFDEMGRVREEARKARTTADDAKRCRCSE